MKASARRRGQTLVEFAITFPVFVALLFSLIEGGRLMFTWVLLSEATREGARVGILEITTHTDTITSKVNELAKYAPGYPRPSITVYRKDSVSGYWTQVTGTMTKFRDDEIRVQIDYLFSFLSGNVLPFTSRVIATATEMRVEGPAPA
jgi:Flp pilus assembly protein TadG